VGERLSGFLTRRRRRLAKRHALSASKWLVATVLAAAVGVPVTLLVTGVIGSQGSAGSTEGTIRVGGGTKEPPTAKAKPVGFSSGTQLGYGPDRVPFRCERQDECAGPRFVSFNSYFNAPEYGDERAFFDAKRASEGPGTGYHDSLHISSSTTLLMRAYIDNDTYQDPSGANDAIDTRLRLELPDEPVYDAHPTAYLRADNAKPRVVWDTVHLYASRPMRIAYVPGSAEITRRDDGGPFVTEPAPDGVETEEGMDLGRFKPDFVNAALVTFRVRVTFLPEPVRDPRATWTGSAAPPAMLPPASSGPLREPRVDSDAGARFHCGERSCQGPPYVALNAYENHPLLGDEADFVRAEPDDTYSETGESRYASVAQVRPGDRLDVRVLIDNGGDPDAIGAPPPRQLTARDVRVRAMLPAGPANSQAIVVFIDCPNAIPTQIVDTLSIRSRRPVRIRYLPHTASLATNDGTHGVGSGLFALSDQAREAKHWGMTIAAIPPSFSAAAYVDFTVEARPAA
jgi:hypothetical protein